MVTPTRYILLALGLLISLHLILSFAHEEYGQTTSLSRLADSFRKTPKPFSSVPDEYYVNNSIPTPPSRKAKAAFVILARNGDLSGVLSSMKQLEDRFNRKFQYPYVFLNEQPFTDEFKQLTAEVTTSPVSYGLIPKEDWFQPDWIDEEKATKARKKMEDDRVIYGGSVPYRNMCRFNSGFFYRHELLKDYDYYWRVEPGIKFFCDLDYDPFLYMQDNNKVYGFTISLFEYEATIPTLWKTTKQFMEEHPELVHSHNAMDFLSSDGGETYNRCHFWSNFEIASLNFWRSEPYMKYFEYLDKAGGFYYERWGDAPVHSLGVALFADKEQIHFFDDIGYRHEPFQHCPQQSLHTKGKCWCVPGDNFDREWYSCLNKFEAIF